MDDITLAYTAGLLDGEGTFSTTTGGGARSLHHNIRMASTDHEIILWLKETFGGSIYVVKKHKETYKPQLQWWLGAEAAIELASQLIPYLHTKKRQAEILVELSKTSYEYLPNAKGKRVRTITDETQAVRVPLVAELRKLNHRGALTYTDVIPQRGFAEGYEN